MSFKPCLKPNFMRILKHFTHTQAMLLGGLLPDNPPLPENTSGNVAGYTINFENIWVSKHSLLLQVRDKNKNNPSFNVRCAFCAMCLKQLSGLSEDI